MVKKIKVFFLYFKMTHESRVDQLLTLLNLSQFLNLPGTEKRRLCDTLSTAPDRSQEKLIQGT